MDELIKDLELKTAAARQAVDHKRKTILLAADHAGWPLKEDLKPFLRSEGYEVEDLGAYTLEPEDDYPGYMHLAGKRVSAEPGHYAAIIIGGSGQGEAVVVNRYPGVRAVVYYGGNEEILKLSRQHNDANILSLGARFMTDTEAKNSVKLWLETSYPETPRHQRRIKKIDSDTTEENYF